MIPLSLYIHTPWCVQKCPYCDFNSHALKSSTVPESDYVAQLLRDLEHDLPQVWGRRVHSIFIGGGTPSLFSPEQISNIINGVRSRMTVSPEAEITLEANPGTVEQQRFAGFLDAGINRLSLGIQSFNPTHLKRLGRIHDGDEAIRAIEAANAAGFDNVNLDLMFGLPEQSQTQALEDLQQAIELAPTHLSWYQLTLEPNTAFHHRPPPLPEDDAIWAMQEAGQARLAKAGYQQYEISAYARSPRLHCQHNLNYWQFGDYLGIGAGAHGKLTHPDGRITRLWKHKHPKAYLGATDTFVAGQRTLDDDDKICEFMMNALRLTDGVPPKTFEQRTGLSLSSIAPTLEALVADGLIIHTPEQLRTTPKGMQFLNSVLTRFC